MRTITKEFKIYKYEELSEKAKEKVRQDYINNLDANDFTYKIFFDILINYKLFKRGELMNKLYKRYHPYFIISICLIVFSVMFIFNYFLPLEKSLFHYYNIDSRAWHWCEMLISGLAIFYIFKIKNFNLKDLLVSISLGLIVYFSQLNSNWYGILSSLATIISYYSACQIFRHYNQQNKFFDLKVNDTIKFFFLGALYAIPFALINNLAIYFANGHQAYNFSVFNVLPQAKNALAPGISEEIIWHFFLLAFVTNLFKGNIPKNKSAQVLTYVLTVLPHCLIHLPTMFIKQPLMAIFILIFTSVLFGFPMVYLVKNKNLQTSIGFHWAVDFIRFLFVIW